MERRPEQGGIAACAVLFAMLLGCALAASATLVAIVVAPVVGGLLVCELDRSGWLVARSIVRLAGRLLPQRVRQDHIDEWADHLASAGEDGLRPVLAAVKIAFVSAPRLGLRLWLRPFAGNYILALFLATTEVVRADPDERRRGSVISAAKAVVRLNALYATPLLAFVMMRRARFSLPRWILYAVGPSLSTSGETLTIEESMNLEGENGERRNVGDEYEWSWARG